jgi:hypothetical protein
MRLPRVLLQFVQDTDLPYARQRVPLVRVPDLHSLQRNLLLSLFVFARPDDAVLALTDGGLCGIYVDVGEGADPRGGEIEVEGEVILLEIGGAAGGRGW